MNHSILICTYNQRAILAQILESLRRQIKTPKAYEVIIADDCSSDGTDNFVRNLRYPIFLKYVRADSNMGRAPNRDRGFRKAMGRWVICIDGDMVPDPNFIESYARAWEEFHEAACVGSYRYPDGSKIDSWQQYFLSRGRLPMGRGAQLPGKYFTRG